MKKFNVGVVGYGWAAGAHIAALNATSRAQVTAVASSRPLDPDELSAKHGGRIACYRDLRTLLKRPDVDAVSICSLPQLHARQAIAAARAGKHIIIEKPVALSWNDCLAVHDAARRARVRTCVCFEGRFSSQFLTTKEIIDSGLLGEIHYGEVDYYHGIGPWYGQFRWNVRKNAGGSSLLSAGCHALDALLLCMDGDVVEVTSYATGSRHRTFRAYEYPTTSATILKFRGGAVGKVASVIDCWQPYYFHTHLVGSEGSLLDDKFHSNKLGGLDKQRWSRLSMKMMDSGDVADHPYQKQFEAFFEAIEKRKEMPLTSLGEALRSFQAIFAADLSAKKGRPVRLRGLGMS